MTLRSQREVFSSSYISAIYKKLIYYRNDLFYAQFYTQCIIALYIGYTHNVIIARCVVHLSRVVFGIKYIAQ